MPWTHDNDSIVPMRLLIVWKLLLIAAQKVCVVLKKCILGDSLEKHSSFFFFFALIICVGLWILETKNPKSVTLRTGLQKYCEVTFDNYSESVLGIVTIPLDPSLFMLGRDFRMLSSVEESWFCHLLLKKQQKRLVCICLYKRCQHFFFKHVELSPLYHRYSSEAAIFFFFFTFSLHGGSWCSCSWKENQFTLNIDGGHVWLHQVCTLLRMDLPSPP